MIQRISAIVIVVLLAVVLDVTLNHGRFSAMVLTATGNFIQDAQRSLRGIAN